VEEKSGPVWCCGTIHQSGDKYKSEAPQSGGNGGMPVAVSGAAALSTDMTPTSQNLGTTEIS
jgi:hypothetical protein